jgi:hypothetical protein
MPMSAKDWKEMRTEFKALHERQNDTDKEVTKNTTDIGWLKRSHAAVVTIASSLIIALLLWAVFGGG